MGRRHRPIDFVHQLSNSFAVADVTGPGTDAGRVDVVVSHKLLGNGLEEISSQVHQHQPAACVAESNRQLFANARP